MNLDELESRLQTLIEVRLLSVLPGQRIEDLVIQKLAAAMQSNLTTLADGTLVAPNVFTVIVNPASAPAWRESKLLETLVEVLKTVGGEAGYSFSLAPTITISTDRSLSLNDANVMASQRVEPMAETKGNPNEDASSRESDHLPENAFLIIEGVKVFPLKASVINIGRRLDNQLVIDDPRVSRNHAQLRAINGRFVMFDLNSTGGTFVNGQRANQTVLYPGDVISLAGVALIFGQDNPPPRPDRNFTISGRRGAPDSNSQRPLHGQNQEEMSGPIVLVLRLLMALCLYGFLAWAFYTLWQGLNQEAGRLIARRAPELSLTVSDGSGAPTVRHFIQSEITLGRDPICDIAIGDETASARHARISYHHGQWWVEDLGSTNGTRLNQVAVTQPTVLTTGDEIRCGNMLLRVNMTAEVMLSPTQQLTHK